MHVTGGVSSRNDTYWGSLNGLASPRLFCIILTKHPTMLPSYKRDPTRGNSAAIVLRLPESEWHARHYLELFVSPAGEFPMPPPALAFDAAVADQPITQSLSTERNLILCVRHLALGGSLSSWRPEVQLWLTIDPQPAPTENPLG